MIFDRIWRASDALVIQHRYNRLMDAVLDALMRDVTPLHVELLFPRRGGSRGNRCGRARRVPTTRKD